MQLLENKLANSKKKKIFDSLVGIDEIKNDLVETLTLILAPEKLQDWISKHHSKGFPLLDLAISRSPLVLLSGDVGCGKTALAHSVAGPVEEKIGKKLLCMETPSDIRGSGLVGELSQRITAAFREAKAKVESSGIGGILIIDEADDLATSREQMQAHHEDRAGVNVLIKQLDQLQKEDTKLAVILITNRLDALDPAVVRRAMSSFQFNRPNASGRRALFHQLFFPLFEEKEIEELVEASRRNSPPYSYSDLVHRVGKAVVLRAFRDDKPVDIELVKTLLSEINPSPSIIS